MTCSFVAGSVYFQPISLLHTLMTSAAAQLAHIYVGQLGRQIVEQMRPELYYICTVLLKRDINRITLNEMITKGRLNKIRSIYVCYYGCYAKGRTNELHTRYLQSVVAM